MSEISNQTQISELERRVGNFIRPGVIHEVLYEEGLCRVNFGERISPKMPWLETRAGDDISYWHPDVGEQVLVLAEYGDATRGWVLRGFFSNQKRINGKKDLHRVEYSNGTSFEYDKTKKTMKVNYEDGSLFEYNGETQSMKLHSIDNFEVSSGDGSLVKYDKKSKSMKLHSEGTLEISALDNILFVGDKNLTLRADRIDLNP
jgi:phage baseplate assembly protein gpV